MCSVDRDWPDDVKEVFHFWLKFIVRVAVIVPKKMASRQIGELDAALVGRHADGSDPLPGVDDENQ